MTAFSSLVVDCALGAFAALVLAGTVPGARTAAPQAAGGEFAERVQDLLSRAAAFGFSGQVVVEKGGQVSVHEACGFADRGRRRPMETSTKVGIASLSKQFTAAAILALREEGRLDLEDPLSRFLPELSEEKGRLTLHQLLTHTSGLRGGDIAGDDFEIDSRQELLRRIDAVALAGAPGERWRYSNAGYNLLASVVESLTGAPYEEYLLERIFRRAGMEDTGFWHYPEPDGDAVSHAYRAWMDQGSPAAWPRDWRVHGSGDVLSTAGDLHRWEVALRAGTVLSTESVGLLRSPHAPIGGHGDSYGYGWFVHAGEDGNVVLEHGGDWLGGYNAFYWVDVARGLLVIVTCNATDGSGMWLRQAIQKRLIDLATGEPVELPPKVNTGAEVDRAILGTYRVPGGRDAFHLFDDGAYVWLAARGQGAADLMLGVDGAVVAGLEDANRRSARLLAGLLRGGVEAYEEALGDEGRPYLGDYQREWAGVTARFGMLEGFEILGASPGRRSATVHARLSCAKGETSFSLLWAERGRGRLHGTVVRDRTVSPMPLPAAYPVAVDEQGLIAHDLFREQGVRLAVRGSGDERCLVVRSVEGDRMMTAWAAGAVLPAADGWRNIGGK